MAKKKQQLSYGPNLGLIGGARDVALSEAAKTSAGGTAFAKSLTQSLTVAVLEKKQREDKLDSWMDNLGGIENINLLDKGYNKEAVTDFLRNGRDEYAVLAQEFEKTKDRAVKDKMDEIKFSFQNLNNQLQSLAKERTDYADAYDKGQLVTLENGDERFVDMYTNQSAFGISANGDIGYIGKDGSQTKFKDIAGKWNTKNNIAETFLLEQNLNSRKSGESGKAFYRDDTKNLYSAKFKETGPEGIMVMAKTDLTGDNNYILPNGQKAGNLSFESMWSQGILDDKFYEQIPKGTDSKWMYDKKNNDVLNDLMSDYYTDVTESFHGQGKANYKPKGGGSGKTSKKAHPSGIEKSVQLTDGQYMQVGTARTIKSNLETGTSFKWNGVDYKYDDGKWQTPEGIVGDGTADDIVYNITNDQAFQGITTEKKTFVNNQGEAVDSNQEEFAEENVSSTPGLKDIINVNTLDQDDSVVALSLNNVMPTPGTNANKAGYKWRTARGHSDALKGTRLESTFFGDFTQSAIELVDIDGKVVTYPAGHEYDGERVIVNIEDKINGISMIDNILETFNLAGNIKTTRTSPASGGGGKILD